MRKLPGGLRNAVAAVLVVTWAANNAVAAD